MRAVPKIGTKKYKPKANHIIINWGNSTYPYWWDNLTEHTLILNLPRAVTLAVDKLKTFQHFVEAGVSHPDWTQDKEMAKHWIEDGHKIFCRTSLTSHSGNGIIIAKEVDELVAAPLYTKAVKKDKEYRVHVFGENIIDFQQKKKKQGFEGGISGIRNHTNGWIYARSEVDLPEDVRTESIKAVTALGLDFGAVDVCTNIEGKVFVFEVNTAPGLHGTTLQKYTEAFKGLLT